MFIKQISIFLENKAGRLADVTNALRDQKINIRALSLADTSDFGILRLIVDNPQSAYQTLKLAGFTVSQTDVIAVQIDDSPGGLQTVLQLLADHQINVEYLYAFLHKKVTGALVVFRVEDIQKAIDTLLAENVTLLQEQEVYQM